MMMKLKIALGIFILALAVILVLWKQQTISRLQAENLDLQEQAREASQPAKVVRSGADQEELNRLRAEHDEILRLRAEVARLQKEQKEVRDFLERAANVAPRPAAQNPASAAPSPVKPEEVFPVSSINFTSAQVVQVLDIYKEITGRELIIGDDVKNSPNQITFTNSTPLTHSQTIKVLQDILKKQAGVEIKALDEKRDTATFNPELMK